MPTCLNNTNAKTRREIRAYEAYLDSIKQGNKSFIPRNVELTAEDYQLEIAAEIELIKDHLRNIQ